MATSENIRTARDAAIEAARTTDLEGVVIHDTPPVVLQNVFTLDHIAEQFDKLSELFSAVASDNSADSAHQRLKIVIDDAVNTLAMLGVIEFADGYVRHGSRENERIWQWVGQWFTDHDPNCKPFNYPGWSATATVEGKRVDFINHAHAKLRAQKNSAFCRYLANRIRDKEESLTFIVKVVDGQLMAGPSSMRLPGPDEDDGSAYVLSSKIRGERFDSAVKLKRWLDTIDEKTIRRRKPSPQRLEIHAGDWANYWAEHDQRQSKLLDDENLQEQIADIAARTEIERRKKQRL